MICPSWIVLLWSVVSVELVGLGVFRWWIASCDHACLLIGIGGVGFDV